MRMAAASLPLKILLYPVFVTLQGNAALYVATKLHNRRGEYRMRNAARAVSGLLATALALVPAWATTAVERTETDLIQESAIIVTGHCTHLQSEWLDRTLVTIATISVSEVLKGQPGA